MKGLMMLKFLWNFFGWTGFIYGFFRVFDLIDRSFKNFFICSIPVILWYLFFFLFNKNTDNLPPEPTSTPINPPDKPNPPDLASVQFNEFIKKAQSEKVPRE